MPAHLNNAMQKKAVAAIILSDDGLDTYSRDAKNHFKHPWP